ncbi:MAG TPA: ABC transporter permease [Natronosporangium sp.]|nr:ABC transporter permease [Natronosporangium sp.]
MTSHLAWTERKLLVREPLVLVVSLLFPILLMVLLLVSFSEDTEPVYGGIFATDFYVTAYLSAAVAVMGFMAMPAHLAAYRASGVLRRFRAAGVPARSLVASQVVVMAAVTAVGTAAMVGLAYAGFDLAAPRSTVGVLLGLLAGILAFAGIGALLGSVMRTARGAQGLGLLLFFATFFVAGGGPPPEVLPQVLNDVAAVTPIGLLVDAVREPWTRDGLDLPALLALAAIAVAGLTLATRRLSRPA